MPLPCDLLPANPPGVSDIEANPSDEVMAQAVISLAPRGAAWGTDEVGNGHGASDNQLTYWGRIGAAFGHLYRFAFDTAVQAHPSAISTALEDWERELGLPDPCSAGGQTTEARLRSVRMKYSAIGGSSPGYFICLARSAGYEITIEEPDAFQCDSSECDGGEYVADVELRQFWIVTPADVQETWFHADEGEIDIDPLEGYVVAAELECLLRSVAPLHTRLIFNYA